MVHGGSVTEQTRPWQRLSIEASSTPRLTNYFHTTTSRLPARSPCSRWPTRSDTAMGKIQCRQEDHGRPRRHPDEQIDMQSPQVQSRETLSLRRASGVASRVQCAASCRRTARRAEQQTVGASHAGIERDSTNFRRSLERHGAPSSLRVDDVPIFGASSTPAREANSSQLAVLQRLETVAIVGVFSEGMRRGHHRGSDRVDVHVVTHEQNRERLFVLVVPSARFSRMIFLAEQRLTLAWAILGGAPCAPIRTQRSTSARRNHHLLQPGSFAVALLQQWRTFVARPSCRVRCWCLFPLTAAPHYLAAVRQPGGGRLFHRGSCSGSR